MKYKVSGAIAIPKASWGCAPALPNRFRMVSLEAIFRTFHVKHSVATVPPEQLQDICFPFRFHKAGRSCSPRLEKLSLFSPPAPCAKRMAQGFHCLRLVIENTSPRKTIRIRFGKAGAHPQLALEIAIAPETLFSHYNLLILKAIAILSICS